MHEKNELNDTIKRDFNYSAGKLSPLPDLEGQNVNFV